MHSFPCGRALFPLAVLLFSAAVESAEPLKEQAEQALKRAATYYRETVATHGGYVYHYSLDLKTRWGEGLATTDQVWVQPPGTPTVGIAYLEAYAATGDRYYLDAATEAGVAIVYGQLQSGGWQNCIDFNPRGERVNLYRNGKGGGKRNNSSLDDGQTSTALLFLVRTDKALDFQHAEIHDAALVGMNALLAAQFPNGAFPQVWTGPVSSHPIKKANYPDYDWRTEGRIKEYWNMYTLNDNVAGYVARTLIAAHEVYQDPKYLDALKRLGDFLNLAQMPAPQRGWAQQYNYDMQPIWARRFEPPGVSGDETQEAIETLLTIYAQTRDEKYLQPIPDAIAWLKKSQLPGGLLARFYELRTNRPLYMTRRGDVYSLTYEDSDLPSHYGWKTEARIKELEVMLRRAKENEPLEPQPSARDLDRAVRPVVANLDPQGRWTTTHDGRGLVGQPKIRRGEKYLSSEVFSRNVGVLSQYLRNTD